MKHLITGLLILFFAGCGFGRLDYWDNDKYFSVTVCTMFKEIKLGPYQSSNNEVDVYTPWFLVKSDK